MKKWITAILSLIVFGFVFFWIFIEITEDDTGPQIFFSDEMPVYIHDDEYERLLQGVSAKDKRDGDVTSSLLIENIYPNDDGVTATVIYVARDTSNNITKVRRTIKYESNNQSNILEKQEQQQIELMKANEIEADEKGEENSEMGEHPVIHLSESKVVLMVGQSVNQLAYVDSIIDDKDDREMLYQNIQIEGSTLNTDQIGTYELIYFVVDSDGNKSNEEKLTFVVQ